MTRAVIYSRFSSDRQHDASIADQVEVCRRLIERNGWTLAGTYEDRALSGGSRFRPGYGDLLQDAKGGQFEVVVCEALDRLGRKLADIAALHDELSFLGIRIVTHATGEITPMHIGLLGTMAQLYVSDLAEKTRRGQLGRVRAGRSPGGLPYGYEVAQSEDGRAGGRRIKESEARIVRRIFEEFVAGSSPRAIVKRLNAEAVPGPGNREWRDTTIRGQRDRGTGFLNNEIYTGRLVWNRCTYVKNPATGKRLARINPSEAWEIMELPDLRIIPDSLWGAAKARQEAISHEMSESQRNGLNDAHRPRFLLSKLMICGECGGGYTINGKDRYGCATHRSKGTCSNGRSIKRQVLEERVFAGLRERLMAPEMIEAFAAEFHAEINRLAHDSEQRQLELRRELKAIEKKIAAVLDAIEGGAFNSSVKERLDRLEHRQREVEAELQSAPPNTGLRMHPKLAVIYRRKVEELETLFEDEASRDEAFQIVRSLIDRIVLTPTEEGLAAELHGDLAAILAMCDSQKQRRPTAETVRRQLSVVARARFDLCRTQTRWRYRGARS